MVVLFDFDEVFVDLNTGALKYVNEKKGTNYTLKDVTSWDFFDKPDVRDPFFEYLALPNVYQEHVIPNKKMINVLKQMVEMGKEVYIVTASVESSQESKYKFIKEHMSFFNTDNLFTVNNSSFYITLEKEVNKSNNKKL
jgi:5'(3')-deoxyribonucleotidase